MELGFNFIEIEPTQQYVEQRLSLVILAAVLGVWSSLLFAKLYLFNVVGARTIYTKRSTIGSKLLFCCFKVSDCPEEGSFSQTRSLATSPPPAFNTAEPDIYLQLLLSSSFNLCCLPSCITIPLHYFKSTTKDGH